MAPSPKVATCDLKPEMSAFELKDQAVEALKTLAARFRVFEFCESRHGGAHRVFEAVKQAVETTDACLAEVLEEAQSQGYLPW